MPEALYVQDGEYSAAEDRQAIALSSTAGIVRGLVISAGVGLSVTVSRGAAVIDDPDGVDADGRYGAYIQIDTSVPIPASSTNYQIYITLNATTGVVAITSGATPSGPSLPIGTVTSSSTGITSVANTGARAYHPGIGSDIVRKSGDTMSGVLTTTQPITATGGVKIGGAANATKRFVMRAYVKTAIDLVKSAWSTCRFDTVTTNINDYGTTAYDAAQGSFTVPVAGVYQVAGHFRFVDTTVRDGVRYAAVYITNSAGTLKMRHYSDLKGWGALNGAPAGDAAKVWDFRETNPNHQNWFGVFDLAANDKIYFHYYQNASVALTTRPTADADYGSGEVTWAMVSLMQAL